MFLVCLQHVRNRQMGHREPSVVVRRDETKLFKQRRAADIHTMLQTEYPYARSRSGYVRCHVPTARLRCGVNRSGNSLLSRIPAAPASPGGLRPDAYPWMWPASGSGFPVRWRYVSRAAMIRGRVHGISHASLVVLLQGSAEV